MSLDQYSRVSVSEPHWYQRMILREDWGICEEREEGQRGSVHHCPSLTRREGEEGGSGEEWGEERERGRGGGREREKWSAPPQEVSTHFLYQYGIKTFCSQ